jgi:hypothetical protein
MKYMIIPTHSSVYYAPLIPKREYNVERQLTYDLYYQCNSEVKLTKDTQLEVFLLRKLKQLMYIFIVANQNILCDIFFVKIVLSCSSNLFILGNLSLQFSFLFFSFLVFRSFFKIIYLVFQTQLNYHVNCDISIVNGDYDILTGDVTVTAQRRETDFFPTSIFDNSSSIIIRKPVSADVDLFLTFFFCFDISARETCKKMQLYAIDR